MQGLFFAQLAKDVMSVEGQLPVEGTAEVPAFIARAAICHQRSFSKFPNLVDSLMFES